MVSKMKHFQDTEICKRTVEEFDRLMQKNGTNIGAQCARLGMSRNMYYNYATNVCAPRTCA